MNRFMGGILTVVGLHPWDETVTKGNQTVTHWSVKGIDECVNTMIGKGATVFLYKVAEVGGGIKVATIFNPWGNAVGLIEET
jgi:predicted aconitase